LIRKVYWDSCLWIALVQKEAGRCEILQGIWRDAERGEVKIITSTWAIAECVRSPKDRKQKPFGEEQESLLDALFLNTFVTVRQVDFQVARLARRLVRTHKQCRKPIDGAQLATALLMNVDEMHTFEEEDLLHLDGKCTRQDGKPLKICKPFVIQIDLLAQLPSEPARSNDGRTTAHSGVDLSVAP
jgi:predicted nucleic acid-binding protein